MSCQEPDLYAPPPGSYPVLRKHKAGTHETHVKIHDSARGRKCLRERLDRFNALARKTGLYRLGLIKKVSPATITRRGHRGDSRRISTISVWSGLGTVGLYVRALVQIWYIASCAVGNHFPLRRSANATEQSASNQKGIWLISIIIFIH